MRIRNFIVSRNKKFTKQEPLLLTIQYRSSEETIHGTVPQLLQQNKFRQQLFLQFFRHNYTTYSKYFRQHLFLQSFRNNYKTYSKYFTQQLFLQLTRNNYTTFSKYFRKHLVLLDTSQVIKLLAKVKLVIGSLCENSVLQFIRKEKRAIQTVPIKKNQVNV